MQIDSNNLIRKLPAMIQGRRKFAKIADGGELARYKNREQCTYVLEMLMSAIDADERTFIFPAEKELEHAKQHGATGGGKRHGSS